MKLTLTKAFAVSSALFVLAGCGGGDGGPAATPTPNVLLQFTGEGIEQADSVRASSADVDICETLDCGTGIEEAFAATRVKAVFVNLASEDLTLVSYTVTLRAAGVAPVTRGLSATVRGGRCSLNASQPCAEQTDCGELGGTCVYSETAVELVLYDVGLKVKLRNGECDRLVVHGDGTVTVIPSTVSPRAFNVDVDFSGLASGNRLVTVGTRYLSTFGDFRNCPGASSLAAGTSRLIGLQSPTPTPTPTPVPGNEE